MTRLKLDQLRLDGGTQSRLSLDFDAIKDYQESMAAGAKFPVINVCYDGQFYWVVDGFHRINAARQAGLETVAAEVWQGTLGDAQWRSYAANPRHGLRRTNGDKQRVVKAALVHPCGAGLSDRQLARHCGVTTPTVSAWREKLGPSIKTLQSTTRTVTRRGTTYQQDTTNIGRPSAAAQAAEIAETSTSPQPTVGPASAGPTSEPLLQAVAKIIALDLTASEFEGWLAQQSDQSELTVVLEKLNALITQVLARTRVGAFQDRAANAFQDRTANGNHLLDVEPVPELPEGRGLALHSTTGRTGA